MFTQTQSLILFILFGFLTGFFVTLPTLLDNAKKHLHCHEPNGWLMTYMVGTCVLIIVLSTLLGCTAISVFLFYMQSVIYAACHEPYAVLLGMSFSLVLAYVKMRQTKVSRIHYEDAKRAFIIMFLTPVMAAVIGLM